MPRASSACSRVCPPSPKAASNSPVLAGTTSSATSACAAPAIILGTKSACPGASRSVSCLPDGSRTIFCATSMVTPCSRSVSPSSMAHARWKLLFPCAVASRLSLSTKRDEISPQCRSSRPMSVLFPASTWPMTTMLRGASSAALSSSGSGADGGSSSRLASRMEPGAGLGVRLRLPRDASRGRLPAEPEDGIGESSAPSEGVGDRGGDLRGLDGEVDGSRAGPGCGLDVDTVPVRISRTGEFLLARTGRGTTGPGEDEDEVFVGVAAAALVAAAAWAPLLPPAALAALAAKMASRLRAGSCPFAWMMPSTSASLRPTSSQLLLPTEDSSCTRSITVRSSLAGAAGAAAPGPPGPRPGGGPAAGAAACGGGSSRNAPKLLAGAASRCVPQPSPPSST
mmetsp:Transcript_19579/g.59276  ORF Transcript_19579/g.59276 Transcript_19579/m.59276 type:complete len:397 (-) Transcript_19579:490-1680(-)